MAEFSISLSPKLRFINIEASNGLETLSHRVFNGADSESKIIFILTSTVFNKTLFQQVYPMRRGLKVPNVREDNSEPRHK